MKSPLKVLRTPIFSGSGGEFRIDDLAPGGYHVVMRATDLPMPLLTSKEQVFSSLQDGTRGAALLRSKMTQITVGEAQ